MECDGCQRAFVDIFVDHISTADHLIANQKALPVFFGIIDKADLTHHSKNLITDALSTNFEKFKGAKKHKFTRWRNRFQGLLLDIDTQKNIDKFMLNVENNHRTVTKEEFTDGIITIACEDLPLSMKLQLSKALVKMALRAALPEETESVRAWVVLGLFPLLCESDQTIVDFIDAEINTCTCLPPQGFETALLMSNLTKAQHTQLATSLSSKTQCEITNYSEALLGTFFTDDQRLIDLTLAKIAASSDLILDEAGVLSFTKKLTDSRVPIDLKCAVLQALVQNMVRYEESRSINAAIA
jgi:hypothetical protein